MMAAKAKTFAMVKERALIARINRKLKPDDMQLKKARGYYDRDRDYWYPDSNLGWYYTINTMLNCIVHTFLDLESYGRELGVLAAWEKLSEE
jgi:hypothetical protein